MGVKELWTVLSPVKEQVSISSLAGKTLAVDLSGWVCQAATIPSPKPHLRQLFVRVWRLYREGVRLVIVLDGAATHLKWGAMDTRAKAMGRGTGHRNTGTRSSLNRLIRECTELLDLLGVPHVQSVGEAEALCALLNREGVVDGVLTQDGDAFLYGATVVYKDLSITDYTVDCYTVSRVQSELGLIRTDLVSLALLVGCDYCPQGVPGVGRVAALKFIADCKPRDSLEVMKRWTGAAEGSESKVQRLSRGVPGFPSAAVIREFMTPKDTVLSQDCLGWKMPFVLGIQLFCKRELEWSAENTCKKAQALLTAWVISKRGHGLEVRERDGRKCSLRSTCIVKGRMEKKVACFEVKWSADHRLAGNAEDKVDDLSPVEFSTIENAQKFRKAYPDLCEHFEHEKFEKQKAKAKPKSKGKRTKKASQESCSPKLTQSPIKDYFSTEHSPPNSEHLPRKEDKLPTKEPIIDHLDSETPLLPTNIHPVSPTDLPPSSLSQSPPTPPPSPPSQLAPPLSTPPHSSSVIQVDSDSDDDHKLTLFERLKLHSTPQKPPPSHLHIKDTSESLQREDRLQFSSPRPQTKDLSPKPHQTEDRFRIPSPIVVVSSDDKEPLPLFTRLRKSPLKVRDSPTKAPSNPRQLKLDSYFPQKKSKTQTTKPSNDPGSEREPILID